MKIDKNVPLPPKSVAATYPFPDLEIGDSFFVEGLRLATYDFNSRYKPKKFTRRSVMENGRQGVRVWRIE